MASITVNCVKCKNTFITLMVGEGIFSCPWCGKKYIRKYEKNGQYYIGEYKDDRG